MADRWARWERTRAGGEQRFVWRSGVLGFGGAMFAVFSARYLWDAHARPPWWVGVPVNLLIWLIAGHFWGRMLWRRMEKEYAARKGGTPESGPG